MTYVTHCDRCVSLVFFRHIIPGHTDDNDGWSFSTKDNKNWNLEDGIGIALRTTWRLLLKLLYCCLRKKVRWSWSSLLNSQKSYDLRAIIHSFFNSIPIPQISPDVSHKSWITIWKMSQRISTALWNLSLQKYTHLSASFALNFPLPVLSSTSFCTSFALNFSLTVHDLELHLHSNLNNDAYLALNIHSTLHSSCTPFCLYNSKMYFTVTFSSVPLILTP